MKTVKWLIVGAGIHGCHHAICLRQEGLASEELLVLDRLPAPLEQWSRRTARVGMQALRSSGVHHIDQDTWSFLQNAEKLNPNEGPWSKAPYNRPVYEVFQAHCQHALAQVDLRASFRQAEVNSVKRVPGGFLVSTSAGEVQAEKVLLASGPTAPWLPQWAQRVAERGEPVAHLFQQAPLPVSGGHTVVVGDGMSGVQYASSLAKKGEGRVTLLGREPLRLAEFDADPCWLGPKCLNSQFSSASLCSRREQISRARLKGTVNQEVLQEWNSLLATGRVDHHLGEAVDLREGRVVTREGEELPADCVILATGFEPGLPGGELTKRVIAQLNLPLSPCGFPILNEQLEWTPGLYVSGGLAELVAGPVARNIAGARQASKRILGKFRRRPSSKPTKGATPQHALTR